MKKASKIMYIIGTIFALIGFIGSIICVITGVINVVNGETEEAKANGLTLLIAFAVLSIVYLIIILIAAKGRKSLDNGEVNIAPHVVAIVVGVLGGDIFFLLGGIFGIIAESNDNH